MCTVAPSVVLCAFATRPRLVAIAGSARAGSSPVSSTHEGPGRLRRSRACPRYHHNRSQRSCRAVCHATGESGLGETHMTRNGTRLGVGRLRAERGRGQAFRYEARDES